MNVQSNQKIRKPDETFLDKASFMDFLGALIHEQRFAVLELSKKIGMCSAYFKSLSQLWKHICIPKSRKVQIFNALISTKLLYGLSTMWLGIAEQRKLDGFQSSCLRKIAAVAPAYHSRVSNARVMELCGATSLSQTLIRQQKNLLHKVLQQLDEAPMRRSAFLRGSQTPVTEGHTRRVGRLRHTWAAQLLAH